MPLLGDAAKIYLGSQEVDKIYLGSTQVWSGAPPTPFTVGEDPYSSSGAVVYGANTVVVSPSNPAPRDGTLTSVTLYNHKSLDPVPVRVVTGKLTPNGSSSSFTVTAVSDELTAAPRADNTLSCEVPLNAGDVVGLWSSAGETVCFVSGSSGFYTFNSSSTPSGTLTGGVYPNYSLCVQATGT